MRPIRVVSLIVLILSVLFSTLIIADSGVWGKGVANSGSTGGLICDRATYRTTPM